MKVSDLDKMKTECNNCKITIQDEYDRTGDDGYIDVAEIVNGNDWFCSQWCANEFNKTTN